MEASRQETSRRGVRRWLWPVVKWSLCLAVLAFVARRAVELWDQDEMGQVQVHFGWLFLSAVAYTAGWLPSVWFWRQLLKRLGGDVGYADASRAYYCGHLGKYVPGKATALVIRAALLKDRGVPVTVSALTATYETLMMMGAGVTVAVALCPLLLSPEMTSTWPEWVRRVIAVPTLPAALLFASCFVTLPLISRLLTYFAARLTPRGMLEGERRVRIDTKLVALGLLAFIGGWFLHGLSLGLTLRAVVGGTMPLSDWPTWTGAVSFSTAIGFFALFAPGGVGVREGLLIETLRIQPAIGPQQAVVAAILTRVVWLVTELVAAAALYWLVRPSGSPQGVAGVGAKSAERSPQPGAPAH